MRFDNLPEPRAPHVIWIDEAPVDRRPLEEWWSGLRTETDRRFVVFSSVDYGRWDAPPDAGEPFEPAMKPQRDMLTWRDRRAHLERIGGRRCRR